MSGKVSKSFGECDELIPQNATIFNAYLLLIADDVKHVEEAHINSGKRDHANHQNSASNATASHTFRAFIDSSVTIRNVLFVSC